MFCRITLVLAVATFLPVAGAAPKPKAEEKAVLYLPTTVGDKRVGESVVGGETYVFIEWVTAVEKKGGMTVVTFAREEGGPTLYRYGASADGVFRVSGGEGVYDPPLPVLKLPAKEEETWDPYERTKAGEAPRKYKYKTVKEEQVETPAGKFRAVRVDVSDHDGEFALGASYWYAPGVGVVKMVSHFQKDELRFELKSFTPANKK